MQSRPFHFARPALAFLLVGLIAAACGGGGDNGLGEPTSLSPTSTVTTTTVAPPTTVPDGPKAPLTGLPVDNPADINRPALAIKVDNADTPGCVVMARPQYGLTHADVVYEILVEGGTTRFMAVFQSDLPDRIEPIRSARSSDIDLIAGLGIPMFAWSGNNGNVAADLAKIRGRFLSVGHDSAIGSAYKRDRDRCAPTNLYVDPHDLYDYAADKEAGVPAALFTYRTDDDAPSGTAREVGGLEIATAARVDYAWNAKTDTWDRFQKGSIHMVVDGDVEVPISPTNVVALEVAYPPSSTRLSPQAATVGEGVAHVYVDGHVIDGTWKRATNGDVWTLLDADGQTIALNPGKTWVQLAEKGKVKDLDTVAAAKFLTP